MRFFETGAPIGAFAVVRRMGEGELADVYEVSHRQSGGRFAAKVIRPDAALNPVALQRYRREVGTIAGLQHPNIAVVEELGVTADGRTFVVSEYLPGATVAGQIAEAAPLSILDALEVVEGVVAALAAADTVGVIHRNLTPANIMLAPERGDGRDAVKVLDFGFSTLREFRSRSGRDPGAAGHAAYLSPEQARGRFGEVDPRSDQFTLAAILYEMLSGRRAFPAEPEAAALAAVNELSPRPLLELNPAVPEEIVQAIARALAKVREQRFPSGFDFLRALRGAVAGLQPRRRLVVLEKRPSSLDLPTVAPVVEPVVTPVVAAELVPVIAPEPVPAPVAPAMEVVEAGVLASPPSDVPPAEEVVAAPPLEEVVPTAAPIQELAAVAPVEEVVAVAPVEEVVAVAPVEEVVAAPPVEEVVPPAEVILPPAEAPAIVVVSADAVAPAPVAEAAPSEPVVLPVAEPPAPAAAAPARTPGVTYAVDDAAVSDVVASWPELDDDFVLVPARSRAPAVALGATMLAGLVAGGLALRDQWRPRAEWLSWLSLGQVTLPVLVDATPRPGPAFNPPAPLPAPLPSVAVDRAPTVVAPATPPPIEPTPLPPVEPSPPPVETPVPTAALPPAPPTPQSQSQSRSPPRPRPRPAPEPAVIDPDAVLPLTEAPSASPSKRRPTKPAPHLIDDL